MSISLGGLGRWIVAGVSVFGEGRRSHLGMLVGNPRGRFHWLARQYLIAEAGRA